MGLLGISFVPFDESIEKRLQILAAATWISIMVFSGLIGCVTVAYVLIHTTVLRWFAVVYLLWVFLWDFDTCDRGGWSDGSVRWVRSWIVWHYCRDYCPTKLIKTADLDPSRNYLLCCFPHGLLCAGIGTAFATDSLGFSSLFPGISRRITTIPLNFKLPLFREFLLSIGCCSVSRKSISYLIASPKKGNAVALMIGGAEEAMTFRPGKYTIVLRKRKGFVKIALEHGTPLVPVFTFGETDLFGQMENPEGSFLRKFQDAFRRVTGFALIIPVGRGFFQESFGLIPRQRPLNVVVGAPLEIPTIANPTLEDVDEYHAKFEASLRELFETHKYKYVRDAKNTQLEIL